MSVTRALTTPDVLMHTHPHNPRLPHLQGYRERSLMDRFSFPFRFPEENVQEFPQALANMTIYSKFHRERHRSDN